MQLHLGKGELHQWSVTPCMRSSLSQGSISSDSGEEVDAAAWDGSQADSSGQGEHLRERLFYLLSQQIAITAPRCLVL